MKEREKNCDACSQKNACADKERAESCAFDRMNKIRHKIIIASGKGGVGKSTVSVNLAWALKAKGYSVGLLDADITGPSIPKLLGIEDQKMKNGPYGVQPGDASGIKVASMALLLPNRDSAIVWRGPMKMAAIRQFVKDVLWGDLDFLLIDLPPGTSDEPLSVIQLIPDMTGAIVVTTPQEVSLLDSRKAVNMVKSMKVPVLGIIENMSGLSCPHCGEFIDIFSTGGGKKAAEELEVPFLGAIPLDPEVRVLGDRGVPFVDRATSAEGSFKEIVDRLQERVQEVEKANS